MQRRVERAFFDAQQVGGDFLDVRRDRVAVQRAARGERFEHEEAERALEDVVLGFGMLAVATVGRTSYA